MRRRGFTLIELLVVVAIITVLLGLLVPALARARDMVRQSGCAANLAGIGKAMLVYAGENNDAYPTQPPPFDGTLGYVNYPPLASALKGDSESAIQDCYRYDPSGWFCQQGDVPGNMWLLVLKGMVQPKSFLCASDPTHPVPADLKCAPPTWAFSGYMQNFGVANGKELVNTFSYAWAYPWYADGKREARWWRNTLNGTLAIGADIGPSGQSKEDDPTARAGSKVSNSKNHGGEGQNVLYADGHVVFSNTNAAGMAGDNIYTACGGAIYVQQSEAGLEWFTTTMGLTAGDSGPIDVILVPARP